MTKRDSKEEILKRMQARREEAMRPKRIRDLIIYAIVVGGAILLVNYLSDNLFTSAFFGN